MKSCRLARPYDLLMRRFVPTSPLGELLAANREQLLVAAERRHARDLRIFGSVARGQDNGESDIDILVTLNMRSLPTSSRPTWRL